MVTYRDNKHGQVTIGHSVINLWRYGNKVTIKRYAHEKRGNWQVTEADYHASPASIARIWALIDSGKFYHLLPASENSPASYISR